MSTARDVIASVPDFWLDQRDGSTGLGEWNANRIINALDAAGYVISHKPVGAALLRQAFTNEQKADELSEVTVRRERSEWDRGSDKPTEDRT